MPASVSFPSGFRWGAATAAYQIEGAVHADGRGESIWDRFAHTPGRVLNGDTGDVACDHYHRFADDVALMADLGLGAYRFSVAWPRVLPAGTGPVNRAGLDFYDRLVDTLLAAGIEPHATLYHWDLPQALEDRGGWPARSTAEAFADYAGVVAEALGDRLASLATINEPWVVAVMGYETGVFAPGVTSVEAGRDAAHHLLVAHGLAVERIRSAAPDLAVGIVLNFEPHLPASDDLLDVTAAAAADARYNRWFIEPLAGLGYPAEGLDGLAWSQRAVRDGDAAVITAPIDFLGVNYYTRTIVRHPDATATPTLRRGERVTGFDWEVAPEALGDVLRFVHGYRIADRIMVTENGAAYPEPIHDAARIAYLADHLAAVRAAIADGVPVAGYFVWSLLDNFEWASGYSQRFGIVGVDFDTLERQPRDSARWYADVARTGRLP